MLKRLCLHCCLLTAAVAADSEYSQCENTMQSLGNSPLTVMHNRCYSAVAVCLSWEGMRMLVQCMYASKPNLVCIAKDSWHCSANLALLPAVLFYVWLSFVFGDEMLTLIANKRHGTRWVCYF